MPRSRWQGCFKCKIKRAKFKMKKVLQIEKIASSSMWTPPPSAGFSTRNDSLEMHLY